MGLPPVEVMTAPVTCMPAWVAAYANLPATVARSGCAINAAGNVACDPAAMARAAGVSLEAYTLARYIQSEVGGGPVPERVAVAQAAINRVKYVEKLGSILNLLLYRQPAGHPNRGFYGPIHGPTPAGGGLTAPYGRWAATSADPTVANLKLAAAILNDDIPSDFAKGADDQNGPQVFIAKYGIDYAVANVQSRGALRKYWVGPLPGVNPLRTMLYRTLPSVAPTSDMGKQLIARGVAAVRSPAPNWANLPPCPTGSAIGPFNIPGSGLAIVGSLVLAVTGVIAALLWRRHTS